MRIAYATIYDPRDRGSLARSGHLIPWALEAAGHEVRVLGPIAWRRSIAERAVGKAWRVVDRGGALPEREPRVLRRVGRSVDAALAGMERGGGAAEALVSFGVLALAHASWRGRVALWCDCTLAAMVGYFPEYTGLSRRAMRHAHDAETRVMRRADVLAFPSGWAAASAVRDYGCDPAKVHVVPFGPSLPDPGAGVRERAGRGAEGRSGDGPWRVLWVGMQWGRKGGDAALAACEALVRRGRKVELVLAGSGPPDGRALPGWVRPLGVVERGTAEGLREMEGLYRWADVLLMPTRADCVPIAIRDAMLFGVPAVVSATGGLGDLVVDGENGRLVPVEADAGAWADALEWVMDRHAPCARAARARHEGHLDWRLGAARFVELLERA